MGLQCLVVLWSNRHFVVLGWQVPPTGANSIRNLGVPKLSNCLHKSSSGFSVVLGLHWECFSSTARC